VSAPTRPILAAVACLGLASCVYAPPAPPPRPVAAPPPVYVAPAPPPVYVAPRPRRVWVPGRYDPYGRWIRGHWRYG